MICTVIFHLAKAPFNGLLNRQHFFRHLDERLSKLFRGSVSLEIGESWPEDVVRISRSELAVEYQSFGFSFFLLSFTFGALALWCSLRCFRQSLLSRDDNEGGGYNHDFSTSADGNPSVFAVKRHSSAVSSTRVLTSCATGRVHREDARAWVVNAFMTDVH